MKQYKSLNIIKLILITITCSLLLIINGNRPATSEEKPISVGIIITHMAVSPTAIVEGTKPLAKYLTKKLNRPIKADIIPDVPTLIKKLDDGSLHVGYVSNLDYIKLKECRDITPFAKVEKGGSSLYNAILLVRKDSGINTLSDLRNKVFAYTSTNSSHGYLFPALLVKKKFKTNLKSFFKSFVKTKKDPDGILAVLYKKADAVGASSQTYSIMAELMPRLKSELKVIETSQPLVHGPIFTYNKNFPDEATRKRVEQEILNMDKTTEGKQVLLLFRIGGWRSASDRDYDSLRNLLFLMK